jgi:hypothetical protein
MNEWQTAEDILTAFEVLEEKKWQLSKTTDKSTFQFTA